METYLREQLKSTILQNITGKISMETSEIFTGKLSMETAIIFTGNLSMETTEIYLWVIKENLSLKNPLKFTNSTDHRRRSLNLYMETTRINLLFYKSVHKGNLSMKKSKNN